MCLQQWIYVPWAINTHADLALRFINLIDLNLIPTFRLPIGLVVTKMVGYISKSGPIEAKFEKKYNLRVKTFKRLIKFFTI
jgi:hypothetical protein